MLQDDEDADDHDQEPQGMLLGAAEADGGEARLEEGADPEGWLAAARYTRAVLREETCRIFRPFQSGLHGFVSDCRKTEVF